MAERACRVLRLQLSSYQRQRRLASPHLETVTQRVASCCLTPPQVTHRRKRHYLGMHASEEEAARAYDQGALCLLVRALWGAGAGRCLGRRPAESSEWRTDPARWCRSLPSIRLSRRPATPAPPITSFLLQGAAASTNYPAEQYDVAALQALDIADLAARLKAASRAAMAAASRAADAVGAGGAGRGAAAQALHQQMAQVQQSAAAKRPRSA